MAVIECPTCNKKISDKLKYCVFCKHKFASTLSPNELENSDSTIQIPKFNYKGVAATIAISVLLGYLIIGPDAKPKNYSNTYQSQSRESPAAPKEQPSIQDKHQSKIESQFSAWNGSHKALVRLVKDGMNDPKSFEHVKTTYTEQADIILVLMTYRGKNGFNAVVTERIYAEITLDGKVISVKETY